MPMPADARAHSLAVVSAMLTEEINELHLPDDVACRVLSLVAQIERHAQILSGKTVSFPVLSPAPAPTAPPGSNVVQLRPRNRF